MVPLISNHDHTQRIKKQMVFTVCSIVQCEKFLGKHTTQSYGAAKRTQK